MENSSLRTRLSSGNPENLDRFIPNRSAMNFDFARLKLSGELETKGLSPTKQAFRKALAEALNLDRTRIFAFKDKPLAPVEVFPPQLSTAQFEFAMPRKRRRWIPQTPVGALDAPDLVDDYCLNLMDWGSSNVLSIALRNTVYLWDASDRSTSELLTVGDDDGPVTSVSWAPDGHHIAVGLNNSHVQLWDYTTNTLLRTLRAGHRSRVGSLAWNDYILTTGGMDGRINNNDVRVKCHMVGKYRGHTQEVCGLKWSASGRHLASGANDNIIHIWDRSVASSNSPRQCLHKLKEHTAAVKALAWCPFEGDLLASGGGDQHIKFWNTSTGECLKSFDSGSPVSALLWSKTEKELLSSHGLPHNQLTLREYPSLVKIVELIGHTDRVLFVAQSPDGCTVASAAAAVDETLKFWNVFGDPNQPKLAAKADPMPFFQLNRIR